MAIEEKELPNSNQWEIKATGADIPKLAGMLTETGNEAYREAFHSNEGQYVKIADPQGNLTHVHQRDVEGALAAGYGRAGATPRMIMPTVPWAQKKSGPGKHKFRYNKLTGEMEEV
jgi:hypothetical protein